MNQRIRKLVEQARQYAWENETHWSANAERERLFEQKFAELIVQECIETLRLVPYNSDREFGDESIYQEVIIKHFGVSE